MDWGCVGQAGWGVVGKSECMLCGAKGDPEWRTGKVVGRCYGERAVWHMGTHRAEW